MTDERDHHTASPEFTESLARDVARLYRYESRFEPVRRRSIARRVAMAVGSLAAAAVVLTVGLVLGTSTGYASARVAGQQQRHEIAATTDGVTRQLDALWMQLVRTRVGLAQLAATKGTDAQASLASAEAEVDSMRATVARISRNLNTGENAIPSRPAFALFRANPMRNTLTALSCAAALARPVAAPAQQAVPVVTLPAAAATTSGTIGAVLSVHQAPDGKVLVDDGGRRQLTLFDSTLKNGTLVLDSIPGAANYYGRAPSSLTPYLGDSVLLADWATRTMRLLDAHGQFGRSVALPPPADVGFAVYSVGGVDSRGRLIFLSHRGTPAPADAPPGTSWSMLGRDPPHPDSMPILRADLELRRVDTIGKIARPLAKVSGTSLERKALLTVWAVDPLATVDDWSVLSDGSVALIRGQDYHIDWVRPSDATVATPKLPFDWKRLTDADKQRLFDSTRAALHAGMADRTLRSEGLRSLPIDYDPNSPPTLPPGAGARVQGGGGGDGGKPCGIGCGVDYSKLVPRPDDVIPLDKIADYYPPLRPGAAIADVDGNVWILPTTSAQSQHGELVYDVVNSKGEMIKRVRVPLGRRIVGFGKGGIVYMTSGDIKSGYILERSVLPKR